MLQDLIGIILFPIALRWMAQWLLSGSGKKKPATAKAPGTSWTHPTSLLLLSATLVSFLAAWLWAPSNLFDTLQLPYNAPNYQLRNAFRDYTSDRLVHDPTFNQPSPAFKSIRRLRKRKDQGDDDGPLSEYEWQTELFELLKSTENRHIYLTFGESVFVDCAWCKQEYDFAVYASPSLLLQYTLMFLVVGLGTRPKGKRHLRMYAIIFLTSLGLFDVSMICVPQEYMQMLMAELPDVPQNFHTLLYQFRWVCFGLVSLVLALLERRSLTETDRLKALLNMQERQLARTKALQLQHMAVQDDEVLAKHVLAFHQEKSMERQSALADAEVSTLRKRVLARHPFSQTLNTTTEGGNNGKVEDGSDKENQ